MWEVCPVYSEQRKVFITWLHGLPWEYVILPKKIQENWGYVHYIITKSVPKVDHIYKNLQLFCMNFKEFIKYNCMNNSLSQILHNFLVSA